MALGLSSGISLRQGAIKVHKVYGIFSQKRWRKKKHYLQQEFKYGVVTVKSEEFGNSLRVQDFEGSILTKKRKKKK